MLKEKDLVVLQHIRENSRQSLAKISKNTGIPTSTVFDKLNRLEKDVVTKHVSLIDFAKLGYNLLVNFAVKTKDKESVGYFLSNNLNINSLYKITPFDFYAECIFKDLKQMNQFKENLEKFEITELEQTFIIEKIKKEEFIVQTL